MRTVAIQAYEDPGHPGGGHAIITLEGVTELPAERKFRLRRADTGETSADACPTIEIDPLGVRLTAHGLELVASVAPALIADLMPGTPMEIELPAARLRGEFPWPDIALPERPKRRGIAVHGLRARANGEARTVPEPAPAAPRAAMASNVAAEVLSDPGRPVAEGTPAPSKLAAFAAWTPFARRPAPSAAVPLPPQPKDQPAMSFPRGLPPATSSDPRNGAYREAAAVDATPARGETAGQRDGAFYTSARGGNRQPAAPSPASMASPRPRPVILARIAGALALAIGGLYVLSQDQRAPGPASAAATVASPAARTASPAVSPSLAPAAAATLGRAASAVASASLFDALAAGTVSPRGASAANVGGARALELANAQLIAAGAQRDTDEGAFWLKRYILSGLGDERTLRALTQLGSLYAEPTGRAPDFARARGLWEIASAGGDPVAMCFLGLLYENGLGVAVDRRAAFGWYERSKQAGGCAAVDEQMARTRQ